MKPEQPVENLGARWARGGQQGAVFLGQIHQDRARFEHARACIVVHEGRDLRVRVDVDKARPELIAIPNADHPCVIVGLMTCGEKLFEHHSDFHAVGGGHGIELQRVIALWQRLVVGGASDWAVQLSPLAAILCVPCPDFGGGIGCHSHSSSFVSCEAIEITPEYKWLSCASMPMALCATQGGRNHITGNKIFVEAVSPRGGGRTTGWNFDIGC